MHLKIAEFVNYSKILMYAIDWQSLGLFAQALPVARSEGKKTDWQSAPSVRLTTELLQETAD